MTSLSASTASTGSGAPAGNAGNAGLIESMQARADARGWVMAPTLWELIEKRSVATPDAVMAVDET